MLDTSNVGNAEQNGSQLTPLERLRPYQIATLVLPGQDVTVIDASDKEFQAFVRRCSLNITDFSDDAWSFDDRIRLINHCRKNGVDLFAVPNKNNSKPEQKQFGNNSGNELIGELFEGDKTASQADTQAVEPIGVAAIRDDIDSLLEQLKKSSDGEQKEFDNG